tara:strand:- start:2164 stop:2706 length:543 start_codon:yes stop_codon:yes gene_type:complete
MWALVEDNEITKLINRPKAMTIGDNQHPHNIFSLWTESELKAIGIYEITVNNTNLKDKEYYQNTDITYTYNSSPDTVTGAYGTATAKDLAELKIAHKGLINKQAAVQLEQYDWYTLRAASGGTAIPSSITTYQAAVRTKSDDMETLIDGAANVDALAALYVYNDNDPSTRPLGEWPSEPS